MGEYWRHLRLSAMKVNKEEGKVAGNRLGQPVKVGKVRGRPPGKKGKVKRQMEERKRIEEEGNGESSRVPSPAVKRPPVSLSVKETGEQEGGGLQEVQGNMEPGVSSDSQGNTGVLKVKKKGRPRKDEGNANNVDSGKS